MTDFIRQGFHAPTNAGGLVDEFIVDSVKREFGIFFHRHLGHDAGAVGTDGFDAQAKFIGDI